jgi:Cu2+-exporting ATPase
MGSRPFGLSSLNSPWRRRVTCGDLELDVQGVHCSGCVWLFQQIFKRHEGAERIVVNPALGTSRVGRRLHLRRSEQWLLVMQQFGYRFGPSRKVTSKAADGLLLRLGVCFALAGNAMLLAVATYFGLSDGPLHSTVIMAGIGLSALSVAVGGSVFIASAYRALRRGILHFDLPIAVGIVLAFAGSTYSSWSGKGGAAYYDTLTLFIALMLLGRWLQERALQRNRARLLQDESVEQLWVRRIHEDKVELVRNATIRQGDQLLLALGDLVPVNASLLDSEASCSLDWINGESEPRSYTKGDQISAGAFNLGPHAIRVQALSDFKDSLLPALLGALHRAQAPSRWWQWLAGGYTAAVLLTALGVLTGWLFWSGDLARAIEVTTAVLVVTCPCAFGIATPLAHELAHAGLRRHGLFICRADFLERARQVTRIVFDKTGTLTTGRMQLVDPSVLSSLSSLERDMLYNLAVRSSHPKSLAVAEALRTGAVTLDSDVTVTEHPGRGLECIHQGRIYCLGSLSFVQAVGEQSDTGDFAFAVDGRVRLQLHAEETMRPDTAQEIIKLRHQGYRISVLSGDSVARTRCLAERLGIAAQDVRADHDPHQKAVWLAENHPEHTLMLGDGVNDALALDRALCSGTPALDRPFMAARTDFYLAAAGLAPVALALGIAKRLAAVVRVNLSLAIVYNVGAVAAAAAGWMSPWLAAIIMPCSSLILIGGTVGAFTQKGAAWRS